MSSYLIGRKQPPTIYYVVMSNGGEVFGYGETEEAAQDLCLDLQDEGKGDFYYEKMTPLEYGEYIFNHLSDSI